MIKIDKNTCTGCELCVNICPKKCILMKEDESGFRYPIVDEKKCIDCHLCKNYCPVEKKLNLEFNPRVFAAQNKVIEDRILSSSGGIFSVISQYVLNNNGVVYGAIYDVDLSVKHERITCLKDLNKLRGSKYLQSHINDSYMNVKKDLDSGFFVAFSGTGCQIAGLKSFLQKEYSNLITIEVVCHGVPSEKVFRSYINEIENTKKAKVVSVNFRDKKNGWNQYNVSITLANGEEVSQKFIQNDFMKGYINNFYLRNSCKNCNFKQMKSGSDILLGDFWGVNELGNPWNDDQGTSVVFINTVQGFDLFNKIKDNILYKETDLEFSTCFNSCIIKPIENSKDIYDDLNQMSLHDAIEKNYISPQQKNTTFISKVKSKFLKMIRGWTCEKK